MKSRNQPQYHEFCFEENQKSHSRQQSLRYQDLSNYESKQTRNNDQNRVKSKTYFNEFGDDLDYEETQMNYNNSIYKSNQEQYILDDEDDEGPPELIDCDDYSPSNQCNNSFNDPSSKFASGK